MQLSYGTSAPREVDETHVTDEFFSQCLNYFVYWARRCQDAPSQALKTVFLRPAYLLIRLVSFRRESTWNITAWYIMHTSFIRTDPTRDSGLTGQGNIPLVLTGPMAQCAGCYIYIRVPIAVRQSIGLHFARLASADTETGLRRSSLFSVPTCLSTRSIYAILWSRGSKPKQRYLKPRQVRSIFQSQR